MVRRRQKRKRSVLQIIKDVPIEITEPAETHPVKPINASIAGLSTETTDIGVAEVCRQKALYIRLNLRNDL